MSFIQWYPGHMHLTRQLIEERIKAIDVVIEVLDARIPGSSFNPLLQTLTGHKPRVKLLNSKTWPTRCKPRLGCSGITPKRTPAPSPWMPVTRPPPAASSPCAASWPPARRDVPAHAGFNLQVYPTSANPPDQHHDGEKTKPKPLTKPASPSSSSASCWTSRFYLLGHPRHALACASPSAEAALIWRPVAPLGRNAYDEELVALELLLYLQKHYAKELQARYKLEHSPEEIAALHDDALLELIGRKPAVVMTGGHVNMQKAAELVITDYRTHALGRIHPGNPRRICRMGGHRRHCRCRAPGPQRGPRQSQKKAQSRVKPACAKIPKPR